MARAKGRSLLFPSMEEIPFLMIWRDLLRASKKESSRLGASALSPAYAGEKLVDRTRGLGIDALSRAIEDRFKDTAPFESSDSKSGIAASCAR